MNYIVVYVQRESAIEKQMSHQNVLNWQQRMVYEDEPSNSRRGDGTYSRGLRQRCLTERPSMTRSQLRGGNGMRVKPTSASAMMAAKQSREHHRRSNNFVVPHLGGQMANLYGQIQDQRQVPKVNVAYSLGKPRKSLTRQNRTIQEGPAGNINVSVANVNTEEMSTDTKSKHKGFKSLKKVFRHFHTTGGKKQKANIPQDASSKYSPHSLSCST